MTVNGLIPENALLKVLKQTFKSYKQSFVTIRYFEMLSICYPKTYTAGLKLTNIVEHSCLEGGASRNIVTGMLHGSNLKLSLTAN